MIDLNLLRAELSRVRRERLGNLIRIEERAEDQRKLNQAKASNEGKDLLLKLHQITHKPKLV